MKNRLRLPVLILSLAVALPSFAADVSTKLGFESKYVSYGTKFAEETWVPMLDVSQGDCYLGIWGYVPTHTQKSFEGEWDFFGGRTLKINKVVSFDIGATVYHYPRTDVDATTLEGFFWVNFDTPLSPKLKLYYDVVVKNWIGEIMVSHTFKFTKTTSLVVEGHGGFRRPEYHTAWYYGTVKADVIFALNEKTNLAVGLRSTNNTDHAAVGHALENWFGASLAHSW
jgi:hypothetical protein